jgi:DegV family protein with EDD domain
MCYIRQAMTPEVRKPFLVTDDGSDLDPKEADRLGVRIVPLTVNFIYADKTERLLQPGEEIFPLMKQFPDHLPPKTSQPNPTEFIEAYRSFPEGSNIVSIHIGTGKKIQISGTFNSAESAAGTINSDPVEYENRHVTVINSETVSIGTRALVMRALHSTETDPEKLKAEIEEVRSRLKLYAVIYDFTYLRRETESVKDAITQGITSKIPIAPILRVYDDDIELQRKSLGTKKHHRRIMDDFIKCAIEGGENEEMGIAQFALEDQALELQEKLREYFDGEIPIIDIGRLISSYTGPEGGLALLAIKKRAS